MAEIYEHTPLGKCLKELLADAVEREILPPHIHDPIMEDYHRIAAHEFVHPTKEFADLPALTPNDASYNKSSKNALPKNKIAVCTRAHHTRLTPILCMIAD